MPNQDYYPEPKGHPTGGEKGADDSPGSNWPAKSNPQSGTVDTAGPMQAALQESAAYGGHNASTPGVETGSPAVGPGADPGTGSGG